MKIIDLLNKIANGEEVPQIFIYNNLIFELNENGRYIDNEGDYFAESIRYDLENLNEKVIIGEDKKDKKIEKLSILTFSDLLDMPKEELVDVIKEQRFKINEIIDYLNKEREQ